MRNKWYFPFFSIVIVCAFFSMNSLYASSSSTVPSTESRSVPKRKVTVGVDYNYPPFEFVDNQGKVAGFNIDILYTLAEVMGLELEFIPGPWNVIRNKLESGSLDMVSGMYYSEQRDTRVDFSVPFIITHESMFVRSDSEIKDISQLKSREVVVQQGDIMHDYVVAHNVTENIVEVKNTLDAIRLIASGSHDAALLPKIQGQYFLDRYQITNVKAAGSAILAQQYCFAVKSGDLELAAILDQGLNILNNSGKYKEIRAKWFGFADSNYYKLLLRVVIFVFIGLFLLLSLSWLWAWLLRKVVRSKTQELEEELSAHQDTLQLLKDKEAHLNALVESSPDAILVFDQQLHMTTCNPAFLNYLGYEGDDIRNKPLSFLLPDGEEVEHLKQVTLTEIEANGVLQDERYYKKKSGELIPMETTLAEILLPNGKLEGYVAIMRDISRRKQAESEREQLEDQLRQVHKMEAIGTLAAGISHDFNNILASIIGFGELAKRSLSEEVQARQDLEEVLESANQAKRLVRQILTYSRRTEQERSPVPLTSIVEESLRLLRASLPANIEIKKDFRVEEDLVLADPTQLNQVIINLVTNGAHAIGDAQGVIECKLAEIVLSEDIALLNPSVTPGLHLALTISDTGHGIDKAVQERMFDPFYTTKQRGEGTGMGLSVVQGIIKDHGGLVQVDSQIGIGSSFQVILPYYHGAVEEFISHGPIVGGNERILLIDDEEKVVNAWKRILASLGYKVIAVTDPLQGLQLFKTTPTEFDIVITDLDMPEMTGLELVQELHALSSTIKVILHTGYATTPTEEAAERMDLNLILHKPVSTYQMAEALRNVLDKEDAKTAVQID